MPDGERGKAREKRGEACAFPIRQSFRHTDGVGPRGKFLVLEGIDGSGKSEQCRRLCAWLRGARTPRGVDARADRRPVRAALPRVGARRVRGDAGRGARLLPRGSPRALEGSRVARARARRDRGLRSLQGLDARVPGRAGTRPRARCARSSTRRSSWSRTWCSGCACRSRSRSSAWASAQPSASSDAEFLERVEAEYARLGLEAIDANAPVEVVERAIRQRVELALA